MTNKSYSARANLARPTWSEMASMARPRLDGQRFGKRETELKRLASDFDVHPQTLRRALAALRFVETIEGEGFLKNLNLRSAPVAAIEHISRWYSYDPAAALRAARELSSGNYTVASLKSAELVARAAARTDGIGKSRFHGCRLRVGSVLQSQFETYEFETPGRRNSGPAVDFQFRTEGTERWTHAAIILAPHRDRNLNEIRFGDWVVRALGLAAIYDHVILVVPANPFRKRCLKWMQENGVNGDAFEIQVISPEP